MELTYVDMMNFMRKYFKGYSKYSNKAEEIDKLDDFYTPDFVSTGYTRMRGREYPLIRKGRKAYKNSLVRMHADIEETMTPQDIMIDEQEKKTVALVRVELKNRKTMEHFASDIIAFYQLVLDENETIKIKSVGVFVDEPEGWNNFYFKSL
jgi:hypothetical protein